MGDNVRMTVAAGSLTEAEQPAAEDEWPATELARNASELEWPATRGVTVVRAPRYLRFLLLGAAAGVVAAGILTVAAPQDEKFALVQVLGFLAVCLGAVGLAAGGALAITLDRLAHRRAREVRAERTVVAPAVAGGTESVVALVTASVADAAATPAPANVVGDIGVVAAAPIPADTSTVTKAGSSPATANIGA